MSVRFTKLLIAISCCTLFAASASQTQAQIGNNLNNRGGVVGGIKIDPSGVISLDKQTMDEQVRQRIEHGLKNVDADINRAADMRMISLKGLEAAITEARNTGQPLSQEIAYMAGLQRVDTIVLAPETNDLIIAGPGEGWKVDEDGNVVGVTTGTPVIQLEDFLVAMRSVDAARTGQGISVSIDPTADGIQAVQALYREMKKNRVGMEPGMQKKIEKTMGQQMITLTGVPADSRFSQVLTAADYKLKRLSMGLEPAPIKDLPSFMELASKRKAKSMGTSPRFWLECNYEPVAKTDDGSVWQIRGQAVKALTQESHFDPDGTVQQSDKQNRFATQWAEQMTEKFTALSAAEPVFRELRNVMDLSVIAAIIKKEKLAQKVGLEIPAILDNDVINTPSWTVPKTVPTQCSFVRLSGSWLVSASGGIMVDSWSVAGKTQTDTELAKVAPIAMNRTADRWWWNAE